jgi:hypothetical protein
MTPELAGPFRRVCRRGIVLGTMLLSGCAFATSEGSMTSTSSYGCLDDSKACVDQRQASLKLLLADRSKAWVRHPATAEDYATGVRMFAFKTRKKELSCQDLAHGRSEADAAGPSLRRASGRLSPAHISRGTMFAAEVSREITAEMRRRCKT